VRGMRRADWVVTGTYLALSFLFGGPYGLLVGAAVTATSIFSRLTTFPYWLASVVFMAAAPFSIVIQGLPSTRIIGPGFGTRHLVAHVFVAFALATAGWGALRELAGWEGEPLRGRSPVDLLKRKRPPPQPKVGAEEQDLPAMLND
jgi:hypothetical protein